MSSRLGRRALTVPITVVIIFHSYFADPTMAPSSPLSSAPAPSRKRSNAGSPGAATTKRARWPANEGDLPSERVEDYVSRRVTAHCAAVSAARARLRSAETLAARSERHLTRAEAECERLRQALIDSNENLSRVRSEVGQSRQEVKDAREFLDGVEKRWGIVDVDLVSDSDNESSEKGIIDVDLVSDSDSENNENVNGGWLPGGVVSVQSSEAPRTAESRMKSILVSNAGTLLVNGRYDLSRDDKHWPDGPIYVHSDGPFSITNEEHDMCLFQRRGYGDKVRWCIGLVPRQKEEGPAEVDRVDECADDDGKGVRRADQHFRRKLELAYIYYWTESDAAEDPPKTDFWADGERASPWGACHGARPLPMLEDATGGGWRRWWRFWRGLA